MIPNNRPDYQLEVILRWARKRLKNSGIREHSPAWRAFLAYQENLQQIVQAKQQEEEGETQSQYIDYNKRYQTRDGRDVYIYTINAGGTFPVHGAVDQGHGNWAPAAWGTKGQANAAFRDHSRNTDLVEVSIESDLAKVPWDAIHPNYNWIAMDPDGRWWAFNVQPTILDNRLEWVGDGANRIDTIVNMPDISNQQWKETRTKRPEQ